MTKENSMENQKCNQEGCNELATHSYVWPGDGETKYSCQPHARKARSIGSALGYRIKLTELANPEPDKPTRVIDTQAETVEGDKTPMQALFERARSMPPLPMPEVEEFCDHVGQTTANVLVGSDSFEYSYENPQPVRPLGFLIWGRKDALVLSIKVNDEEQLAIDGGLAIEALVNPFESIAQAKEWLARGYRMPYTNLALPSLMPGKRLMVKTSTHCVIAVCGIRLKG